MAADVPPAANDYTISGTGTFTYDGDAKTASVTRKETASTGAVTVFYNGTADEPTDAGTYEVTFNVDAARGWSAANGLPAGSITITKAAGLAVSAPSGTSSISNTSITLNPVTAPTSGQTVQYARSTPPAITAPVSDSDWQDSTTFSGLTADITYYFFARSKENNNYETGAASNPGYPVVTQKPNYGISLSPTTITFPAATYGYGAQTAQTVTVNNTGLNATGALTIAKSGTNASSFTVTPTSSIPTIAAGSTGSFTVVPNTGLNAGTYNATVTVSNTTNSITASLSVSFTVNRAAGAAVSAPSGTSSVAPTSITINAVTPAPANGQTIEYAISTSTSTPTTGWQTGTTFNSLTAGTTYRVFARSAQNTNYNAGSTTGYYTVTTKSFIPLTQNVWTDGTITANDNTVWYSFSVTSGQTYYVWWNDSKEGNNKTLDVNVRAAYSSGTSIFANTDSGYISGRSFTATTSTTVHVTVTPFTGGNTGTFAVTYSTSTPITPYTITTTSEWNVALTAVRNGGNGTTTAPKNFTFNINGDFIVPPLTTNSAATGLGTTVTDVVVTLKGSGTLTLSGTGGPILYINSGQSLVVDSTNLTLSGITGNSSYDVLMVQNGGSLDLKNGTIGSNGRYGVNVATGGAFTMSGGEISGNSSSGVYSSNGFTMSGGKISNNTRGVYINNGDFTMTGGEISGNTISGNGGGVYFSNPNYNNGNTFTMSGGEIKSNTGSYGGGVYVNYGNFTMNGTAKINNNGANYGGGVCFGGGGIFNMSSGEISDNTASTNAGGVYFGSGNFNMSGTAKILNNKNTNTNSYSYNTRGAGGVWLNGGTFTMSGGQITGNQHSSTYTDAPGGVYISGGGTFTMSGGNVTGNTNAYNTSSSADMYIESTFNLSGSSSIGSLTLYAYSTSTQYPITLNGAFTGSVTQLNLAGGSSTIATIQSYWRGKPVIKGSSSYTLTPNIVTTKFGNNVLGEFRYSTGDTPRQSIRFSSSLFTIGTGDADLGWLIDN